MQRGKAALGAASCHSPSLVEENSRARGYTVTLIMSLRVVPFQPFLLQRTESESDKHQLRGKSWGHWADEPYAENAERPCATHSIQSTMLFRGSTGLQLSTSGSAMQAAEAHSSFSLSELDTVCR